MDNKSNTVSRKFIENINVSDWEVETNTGWVNIEKSNKTIEYDVWRLELENGQWLECADNHIVFKYNTNSYEEILVKDIKKGEYIVIKEKKHYEKDFSDLIISEKVKNVYKLNKKEYMYDLTVSGEHTYYTNNILSHNTLILSNTAINAVKHGKNVLYITFEIDQRELRKRIDSNFTDFNINNITNLRTKTKQKVLKAKKSGSVGRFIIKEFPPASVSALDIESFLHTLKLKKQFDPDIIVLDYIGIMVPISSEYKNSYEKGKAICEEIRALSDRKKCPILTASQSNRSGYGQDSVVMENIADSIGIAHTADLIISLAQPEELKENNQIKFEIIKSRISKDGAKGIITIDYNKLKIINDKDSIDISISNNIANGTSKIKKLNNIKIT